MIEEGICVRDDRGSAGEVGHPGRSRGRRKQKPSAARNMEPDRRDLRRDHSTTMWWEDVDEARLASKPKFASRCCETDSVHPPHSQGATMRLRRFDRGLLFFSRLRRRRHIRGDFQKVRRTRCHRVKPRVPYRDGEIAFAAVVSLRPEYSGLSHSTSTCSSRQQGHSEQEKTWDGSTSLGASWTERAGPSAQR